MSERKEALVRIIIAIVGGVLIYFWEMLIAVVALVHLIYVIIVNKRSKGIAKFCNTFNTYLYRYVRYITFTTNQRVFPFNGLGNDIEKVDMKVKPKRLN